MDNILNVDKNNFSEEVLNSSLPVLVDFWASWCTSCKMMAPILEEISMEMKDKIKMVKIDAGNPANQELVTKYEIQNLPGIKLVKNNQVIGEFFGIHSKDSLIKGIDEYLKNNQ